MSNIEWTQKTWEPIMGGSYVIEGDIYRPYWTDVYALLAPLKRKKPTTYFVNSMSDLFHPNVTDEMRDRIFAVMALCPQHSFQVLTKRPERMREYVTCSIVGSRIVDAAFVLQCDRRLLWKWPLPNVWLGVSVEDQKTADERIPLLLQTPAAIRFVSYEPALGPIDFRSRPFSIAETCGECGSKEAIQDYFTATASCQNSACTSCGESLALGRLNWVIVGGESGPGARPMHPDWARLVRDQCLAAGVPFFFKQWGEWGPYRKDQNVYGSEALVQTKAGYKKQCKHILGPNGTRAYMQRVGKKAAGHLLDGKEWRQMPEVKR